jgi:hypothetical protein
MLAAQWPAAPAAVLAMVNATMHALELVAEVVSLLAAAIVLRRLLIQYRAYINLRYEYSKL